MSFTSLGQNILQVHLAPLLNNRDLRAFCGVEQYLYYALQHLRFKCVPVDDNSFYLLDNFSPFALRSLRSVALNGTWDQNREVMSHPHTTGVRTVRVCFPIDESGFMKIAGRLETVLDCAVRFPGRAAAGGNIPHAALPFLRGIVLQYPFVPNLEQLCLPTSRLETLSLLSTPTVAQPYMDLDPQYSLSCLSVLTHLGCNPLPTLKVLEFSLPRTNLTQDGAKTQLLTAAYKAAHQNQQMTDGLIPFRLRSRHPEGQNFMREGCLDAWVCLCNGNAETSRILHLTAKEVREFRKWGKGIGLCARISQYFTGDVHVSFDKLGFENMPEKVHGTSVALEPYDEVGHAWEAITGATCCITILLLTAWGKIDDQFYCGTGVMIAASTVSVLRIAVADGIDRKMPANELCNGSQWNRVALLVSALALPQWAGLKRLSIDSRAFQKKTLGECEKHLGFYGMRSLAQLKGLTWITFTAWTACKGCQGNGSTAGGGLLDGMDRLGEKVTEVVIHGQFEVSLPHTGRHQSIRAYVAHAIGLVLLRPHVRVDVDEVFATIRR